MRRLAAALVALASLACMWDSDTLREESLGKKDVLEVVTGKLRHHAAAWYEKKVAYTQPMIDGGKASADRYDDLAVAQAKLGKLDDAIATMTAKDARFPGAYTTEANLGTFYAMKGDRAAALDHLRKAITINPDAHFGREKYQIQLLEWIDKAAADPTLVDKATFAGVPVSEEVEAVINPHEGHGMDAPDPKELDAQIVAITGLIRFGGNDDNMHLWFALGVDLAWEGHKNLAIRALRRAELLGHPRAAEVGRWVAFMDVPLARAAGKHAHGAADEQAANWKEGQAQADADWAAGTKWEQKLEAAEVRLATKNPKKAFGY